MKIDLRELAIAWVSERDFPENDLDLAKLLVKFGKHLLASREWVPVGERLPEKYVRVLAINADQERDPHIDWIDGDTGWFCCRVTHWQPLPPPPEAKA